MLLDRRDVELGGRRPAGGHDKGQETGWLSVGDDGAVADGGVRGQDRLDLAGLDAQSPDLHLPVDPAEMLQRTILAALTEVTGAVHP